VLRVVSVCIFIYLEGCRADVGGILFHEAPVIAIKDNGRHGLTIGPSVVSDREHVEVGLSIYCTLDGEALCFDSEHTGISVCTFYDRSDPNYSIVDVNHTLCYLDG